MKLISYEDDNSGDNSDNNDRDNKESTNRDDDDGKVEFYLKGGKHKKYKYF